MKSLFIAFAFVLLSIQPSYCLDQAAVEKLVDPLLAEKAAAIEVVTVSDKLSHVEYMNPVIVADALPSPLPRLAFKTPQLSAYGSLTKSGHNRYRRTGSGPGGLILDLAGPGKVRDLLAYQTLTIDGVFSGGWTVALADEMLVRQENNRTLGKTGEGAVTASFDLKTPALELDLARARYLVLRLEGASGRLDLQTLTFSRTNPPPVPLPRAAWLWDNRLAGNNPEQLLDRIARHGITRLYLQVDDELERLAPFMDAAARRGVGVWALDGSPDGVNDFSPLLRRIAAVARFNRQHPAAPFAGFQLDVEPYLLKDFSLHRSRYAAQYLQLLDAASADCHKAGFLLSVAVPFWFNQIPINGRDLSWEAVQRADEVVVMGYRTDYAELLEITRPLLAAGEKLGKPILLGIELTPIPDEVHDVFRSSPAGVAGSFKLGGRQWEHARSYTVPGARLSFAGRPDAMSGMLKNTPPFSSFKGWVLHSVEALETQP